MKLVSVVVATYRRETELKNALESLAVQTYPNMEIVLVDDNGISEWNEKVAEIVAAFRSQFPEIPLQYITNTPNQGSAKTRNIGIEAAEGEYITFLDDDDVYLPEKVVRQVAFMEEKGCDYSITDLHLFNEKDQLSDKRIRSYIEETTVDALQRYHLLHHITGTDTMMFRKDYLMQIGGFAPIDVGDEYYLMQRAIEAGGKFGYLPGCDVKAYVHTGEGGLSSGEGKIKGENALYAYKKQYFGSISAKDRRYIRMRHYAVLAFAYLRLRKYLRCMANCMVAGLISPIGCIRMLKNSRQ